MLRPPTVPGVELPRPDYELYMELSRRGLEVTGYDLATSVIDWNWPPGSSNTKRGQVWRDEEGEIRGWPPPGRGGYGGMASAPFGAGAGGTSIVSGYSGEARPPSRVPGGHGYPAYGGSLDTLYETFGAVAFANEIYQLGEDDDGDGRISDLERLRANDEEMDGAAFKEWTAYEHPELGAVEIGGWRKFGQNNPIGDRFVDELRRNVRFVVMQAEAAQELSIPTAAAEVEARDDGALRVTVPVRNVGFVPTELAIRRQRDGAEPVIVEAVPGDGADVVHPRDPVEVEFIDGYDETEVEWLVRPTDPGAPGSITIVARHPKAGRAEATIATSRE